MTGRRRRALSHLVAGIGLAVAVVAESVYQLQAYAPLLPRFP